MGQYIEFIGNHPLLFAALTALIIMLVMNEFKRKLLGFQGVKPEDAVRLMNKEDALVLDVREVDAYREGHIINAKHIPLGLLEGRLDELDDHKEKPLIICCRSGQNAAKAGAILKRQSFTNIYKLDGGIMAWTSANLPLKTKK